MAEIVVGGAACRCTQGSAPCALDIVANSRTIGGKTIANENDAQSCLDGFGFCEILSDINEEPTPCDPSKILKMWVGCDERFFGCGELSAIITTSVLFCTVGGIIFIVESGQVGENKVTNVGEMRLNYAEDMFEVIMGIARLSYRVRGEGPMSHAGGVQELPPIDAGMVLYNLFRYYSSNRDRLDAIEFSEGSMLGLIVYNLARVYGLREKVQNATYNQILAGEPGGLWFVANSPIVAIYEFDANTTQTIRAEIIVDTTPIPPGGTRTEVLYNDRTSDFFIQHRGILDRILGMMGFRGETFTRNGVPTNLGISAPLNLSNMMDSRMAITTGFQHDPNPNGNDRRRDDSGSEIVEIAYLRKTNVQIRVSSAGRSSRDYTNGYLVDGNVYPEDLERLLGYMYFERVRSGNPFVIRAKGGIPATEIRIPLAYSTISLNDLLDRLPEPKPRIIRDNSSSSGLRYIEINATTTLPAHIRISIENTHSNDNTPDRHISRLLYVVNVSSILIPGEPQLNELLNTLSIRREVGGQRRLFTERNGIRTHLTPMGMDMDTPYLHDIMTNAVSIASGFVHNPVRGEQGRSDLYTNPLGIETAVIRKTVVLISVRMRGEVSRNNVEGYMVNGEIYPENLEELLRHMRFERVVRPNNSDFIIRQVGGTPTREIRVPLRSSTISLNALLALLPSPAPVITIDNSSDRTSRFVEVEVPDVVAIQALKNKLVVISIEVLEDLENHPDRTYPNCYFEVKYRITESLITTQFQQTSQNIDFLFSNSNNNDNLLLNPTSLRCEREPGEYTSYVPYFKRDTSVRRGDFGRMDIDIRYSQGRHIDEKDNFRRNMLLRETGRPTKFRIVYEYGGNAAEAEQNRDPETLMGFFPSPRIDVDRGTFNRILRDMEGRLSKNINWTAVFSLARLGLTIWSPNIDVISDIAYGISLASDLFLTPNVSVDVANPLEYRFSVEIVRKWVQYQNVHGDWVNAFFAEKAFVGEMLNPSPYLRREHYFNRTFGIFCYYTRMYRNLDVDTLVDGGEYQNMLLAEWRHHVRHNTAFTNFSKPGSRVEFNRYLLGSVVNELGEVQIEDTVAHHLGNFRSRIDYHQEPGGLERYEDEPMEPLFNQDDYNNVPMIDVFLD